MHKFTIQNEMMEEGPPNLQDQGAGNNGVEAEEEGREGQPVAYVECYSDWRVLKQVRRLPPVVISILLVLVKILTLTVRVSRIR